MWADERLGGQNKMVCPGCYGSQQEGKSSEKMNSSEAKKKKAIRATYVHVLIGCRPI